MIGRTYGDYLVFLNRASSLSALSRNFEFYSDPSVSEGSPQPSFAFCF